MNKYEIIYESLQERVNSGELSIEDAQVLNDLAYDKFGDDDTEMEEVFDESTRLSREINARQSDLSNQIKRIESHLKQIKSAAEKETDLKKKTDLENEIDDVESILSKLKHDHDQMNEQNTIKYGRDISSDAGRVKREENARSADYKNAEKRLRDAEHEDHLLRSEKNLLKRIANQNQISKNKTKIRNLENDLVVQSLRQSLEGRREKRDLGQRMKKGTDKKQIQRSDETRSRFRRSNHHLQQSNDMMNKK